MPNTSPPPPPLLASPLTLFKERYNKSSSRVACKRNLPTPFQINLGNMYYNGLGVEKDWDRAKELYRQAAPTNQNAAALLKEVEEDERKLREEKPEE